MGCIEGIVVLLRLLNGQRLDFRLGFGPCSFGKPPSLIHFWQSHLDFGLWLFSAKQAFICDLFLNGILSGGWGFNRCGLFFKSHLRQSNLLFRRHDSRTWRRNPNRPRRRTAGVDAGEGGGGVGERNVRIATDSSDASCLAVDDLLKTLPSRRRSFDEALLLDLGHSAAASQLSEPSNGSANQRANTAANGSGFVQTFSDLLLRVVDLPGNQVAQQLLRSLLSSFLKSGS